MHRLLPAILTLGAAGSALAKQSVGAIAPGSNPFANVNWHVPVAWQQEVLSSIAEYNGNPSLKDHIPAAIVAAEQPTAVWIATNEAAEDLKWILKEASKDAKKGDVPTLVQLIVYNLPDRDCSAASSEGEWKVAEGGAEKYKLFIDNIAREIRKYDYMRFAVILEPDAFPNQVTNAGDPNSKCAKARDAHIQLLQYAIAGLQGVNTAVYLDSGHGGWLGWPDNQVAAAKLIKQIVDGVPAPARLRGLSINTSNYNPLLLPGIADKSDPNLKRLQWNPGYDNVHYAQALGETLSQYNLTSINHFIVDTSRAGTNIVLETDAWCNVKGAGFGPKPTANSGYANIDALIWAKTPSQADGTSDTSAARYDPMCTAATALQPAPEAGTWFHEYFTQLLDNANPKLV
ncbi:hypothetical protein HK097_006942 [Rhizophlyctis rosea]|uniref:Glucanase n=1 Tax=Rhizophlyctis rosea TaxID=64517 RepID=A0AAD5SCS5_9FUNG|nr:hypothetical protein HK097_006942 [Rhizophlyctis rosea]